MIFCVFFFVDIMNEPFLSLGAFISRNFTLYSKRMNNFPLYKYNLKIFSSLAPMWFNLFFCKKFLNFSHVCNNHFFCKRSNPQKNSGKRNKNSPMILYWYIFITNESENSMNYFCRKWQQNQLMFGSVIFKRILIIIGKWFCLNAHIRQHF